MARRNKYDLARFHELVQTLSEERTLIEICEEEGIPYRRYIAKDTGNAEDYWEWRNSLNLVPHEDTNCRTMRLVYRPIHESFKHRGGVANAINIKNHFS